MLRPKDGACPDFDLNGRNRRPPRDPVNACLSFAYAILVKECTMALAGVGLDPFWGFYHQPRHGRPALALDLMEEFRPLIADSAVITAINTGMIGPGDFIGGSRDGAAACQMTPAGRKALITAIETRLDQLATHPLFDYRCSWRAMIRLQAQLLARWLRRDIPAYQGIITR
jgi:CRISPR-associated protein Cas1